MKFLLRGIGVVAGVLAVVLAILFGGKHKDEIIGFISDVTAGANARASASTTPASDAAAVLPAEVYVVRLSDSYETYESFTGRVVSRRQSDLGFERSGLVVDIAVEEGQRVRRGDILARLDTQLLKARRTELDAQLDQHRATQQETAARLEFARVTAQRRGDLIRGDNVSRQSYDEALFDERALSSKLQATIAAVKAAEAAIRTLSVEMSKSELSAPFDGTIVARSVDEGTAVNTGTPVIRLIEDSALEARIGVSSEVADTLAPERVYDIRIEGRTYPARLKAVLPTLEVDSRTVPAIFVIVVDGPSAPRVGQLARLEMRQELPAQGFWLPLTALTSGSRGLWGVYVLEPDGQDAKTGRIGRRDVQILHSGSERAYVRGTLRNGEKIVATGLQRLVPGQAVRMP